MSLTVTFTNAGLAAYAAAQAAGTLPLVITKVGVSPTAITPLPTMTALAGEIKQISTVSGLTTDLKSVHLTVRDETTDAYTMKSFGLYLASGTLFALYGQPDAIIVKTASVVINLAIDIQFAAIDAAGLTFGDTNFVNPDATTAIRGVVELATSAETITGADAVRAVTPAGLWAAFTSLLSGFGVWRASNDGAGSGLDADLLDGLQATAFVKTTDAATDAAKGVVELATATETQTGTDATRAVTPAGFLSAFVGLLGAYTVWRSTNDGAGSGLDADLLDGQQGAYYADINSRLGYVPANKAGDTFTGAIKRDPNFYLEILGVSPALNFDVNDYIIFDRVGNTCQVVIGGSLAFYVNAAGNVVASNGFYVGGTSVVWHAGNDGAGSGLDADLLDGQQGAWYADVPARLGYAPANKAGDTFGGAIRRDASFYMDMSSGNPIINFDGNDYLFYDRSGNGLSIVIAGSARLLVAANGDLVAGGSLYSGSNQVWHVGNDGAGSGLDADVLDGQQGAYYANIPARLGYTPANKAGDAFTGAVTIQGGLAWHSGNDGAGSGLDADLLDGQDAPYFTNIAARLGYTPANKAGEAFTGAVSIQGGLAWHAGNDGSGSGLDADLLDGQDGSYYANIVARLGYTPLHQGGGAGQGSNAIYIGWSGSRLKAQVDSTDLGNLVTDSSYSHSFSASNGSRLSPDGYIENWVKVMCTGDSFVDVVWDRPFPNAIFAVNVTPMSTTAGRDNGGAVITYTQTGARVVRTSANTGENENNYLFVRANGY